MKIELSHLWALSEAKQTNTLLSWSTRPKEMLWIRKFVWSNEYVTKLLRRWMSAMGIWERNLCDKIRIICCKFDNPISTSSSFSSNSEQKKFERSRERLQPNILHFAFVAVELCHLISLVTKQIVCIRCDGCTRRALHIKWRTSELWACNWYWCVSMCTMASCEEDLKLEIVTIHSG